MKRIFLAILFSFYSATSWAGLCTTMIARICQPGKACRNSETFTQLVNSPNECLSLAHRFCPVFFTEGVASKQVHASFEGAPISGGQNICQ